MNNTNFVKNLAFFLFSITVFLVFLLLLTGCGGGKSTSSSVVPASRAASGAVVLDITWPTVKGRFIPTGTTDLVMQVTSQTGLFSDTKTNTKSASVAFGTPSITISGVPAGGCLVQAFALLKNSDGTQVVLASLTSPVSASVTSNQNTQVNLTLQAALTATTAFISATLQKTLNSDGTPAAPNEPVVLSPLSTLSNLSDGAVYAIAASLSSSSGVVPLPSQSVFLFTGVSNTDYPQSFLTSVDASGKPLAAAAMGTRAYFKINARGSNGNVVVTLNPAYADPTQTAVSTAFPLSAPVPLVTRLMGRAAFQIRNTGEAYYHLIENNFAGENRTPRTLIPPYNASGSQGQLYNTQNPVYDPTGRWIVVSAIQQKGTVPDPAVKDSYGIILIDTRAATITPVNLTAPLSQFTQERCQDPHWSPDGKKIIFQTNTNAGDYTLHIIDVDLTKATPTATEASNSPTFLHGADPLLLADGSIIYVTEPKNILRRVVHYKPSTGSVPIPLPNDAQGNPFTASYYVNPYGSELLYTVNKGDGTTDQLATFDLVSNQPTFLEPSINTPTDNSDPADAGSSLILFSRNTGGGSYRLFVALPGSSVAPQPLDFTGVPTSARILGVTYTP